jgi:hypothetical protein
MILDLKTIIYKKVLSINGISKSDMAKNIKPGDILVLNNEDYNRVKRL